MSRWKLSASRCILVYIRSFSPRLPDRPVLAPLSPAWGVSGGARVGSFSALLSLLGLRRSRQPAGIPPRRARWSAGGLVLTVSCAVAVWPPRLVRDQHVNSHKRRHTMAPHDTSKTQPVTKFKCSTITASVWRNEGGKRPVLQRDHHPLVQNR